MLDCEPSWKPVEGFPNYEVSDHGEVRSLTRTTTDRYGNSRFHLGRVLKQQVTPKGYLTVGLSDAKSGKHLTARVHRLVALAFIPNPDNHGEVNHKDGDKRNSRAENLEWCTTQHNALHSAQMRLNKIVSHSDETVLAARRAFIAGESIRSVARRLKRDRGSIAAMLRGQSYAWVEMPSPSTKE